MKVIVIGGGSIGSAATWDLVESGLDVTVIDKATIFNFDKVKAKFVNADITDEGVVSKIFEKGDIVLSCVPYKYNFDLAKKAIHFGCHFIDFGGNNDFAIGTVSPQTNASSWIVNMLGGEDVFAFGIVISGNLRVIT